MTKPSAIQQPTQVARFGVRCFSYGDMGHHQSDYKKGLHGTGLFVESDKNLEDQDFDVSDEPVFDVEEGKT